MRFLRITRAELPTWQRELEALEQRSVYPLGDDAFRISHGRDYFAFFERLGELRYYAMEDEGRLVCVGCGVLRKDPRRWYLADVKVHPDFRGRHLPVAMMRRAFLQNWIRCGRGYAVAMNPSDGKVPPAVRLLAHFKWIPASLLSTTQLHIFSGDLERTRAALPVLAASSSRGRPHFTSLAGIKDLVLESTRAPLSLLHLRHGPAVDERTFPEPQRGAVHMWCAPAGSPPDRALHDAGFAPSATATIVHHRMSGFDWGALDTSEI